MTIKNATIEGVQIDPQFYHSYNPGDNERGSKDFVMSRSSLMEFNHCPHRWVKGYGKAETDSLSYGNMLDAFILDNAKFASQFAMQPETYINDKDEQKAWSGNSKVCKEWKAGQIAAGKDIISSDQMAMVIRAKEVMYQDEVIKGILETSDFQVMILAEWHDKETGLVIPVKCLIDIVPRKDSQFHMYIADLKSCRTAAPGQWAREVYNWGYHVQAAFYMDMHEAATGEVRNGFAHILQESYEPFEVGKRMLSEEFVELGRDKYEEAMKKYCHCLKSGVFGGYDSYTHTVFDGLTCTDPEAWMISKQD